MNASRNNQTRHLRCRVSEQAVQSPGATLGSACPQRQGSTATIRSSMDACAETNRIAHSAWRSCPARASVVPSMCGMVTSVRSTSGLQAPAANKAVFPSKKTRGSKLDPYKVIPSVPAMVRSPSPMKTIISGLRGRIRGRMWNLCVRSSPEARASAESCSVM